MRALAPALLFAISLLGLLEQDVSASCMEPPPIEVGIREADLVFVGTALQLANNDRLAQVEVHEVWRGRDLPRIVRVNGGPDDPNMITSVDRTYSAGTTYLFVLHVSAVDDRLLDNACTPTTVWRDELAGLRPANARPPIGADETPESATIPLPLLGLAAGLLFVGLASAVAFRRAARRPHGI